MMKKFPQSIFEKDTLVEWRTDNSLMKFISTHIDPGGRLTDTAYDLPDQQKDPGKLSFAPGLLDAMSGVDDSAQSKAVIKKLTNLLKQIATKGDKTSEYAFYKMVTEQQGIIGLVDDFQEAIIRGNLPAKPYLDLFVKDLITKTAHRNAVKIGIAIAGLYKDQSIIPAIKTLALHDEFTLYATIALLNMMDTPATTLWELAQKVDGWGKIQLVNRLTNLQLSAEMRDWLIHEGYKNSIMYEYLAYTCATHGLLHERLAAPKIEKDLFNAAGEIIAALINGGPAEDISMYSDAPNAIEHYIRHANEHAHDISDFVHLNDLKSFLTELTDDIGEHGKNGWTQDIISNCLIDLIKILNRKDWEQKTMTALKSDGDNIYWHAKQAASILGINMWDTVYQKLQKYPFRSLSWYDITTFAPPDKADAVVDFALTHLPLQEYATGPGNESGFGEDFEKYQCLEYAVSFLGEHPRKGEPIILAALDSPVVRNRNTAIEVLKKWTRQSWSSDILEKLKNLKEIEPNMDTKEDLEELLEQ